MTAVTPLPRVFPFDVCALARGVFAVTPAAPVYHGRMGKSALALMAVTCVACGGGNAASGLATAPVYAPKDQAKCSVKASQQRPLIVEWPSADRAGLESQSKKGLIVVKYTGCEMEVLRRCRARGTYAYTGTTHKRDRVTMRDVDDLYAKLPLGAGSLEAKLRRAGELNVDMTIVGTYDADRPSVASGDLEGADCAGATHVVTSLTVGAFDFYAGADAAVGGGVRAGAAGAGASSTSKRETLNQDGDPAACARPTTNEKGPPEGCGALLRLEVYPITQGASATPAAAVTASPPAPVPLPAAPATDTASSPAPPAPSATASAQPAPHPPTTGGRYRIQGDVVFDSVTARTWQRVGPELDLRFREAKAYCASVKLPGAGWRLPTKEEYLSLVDTSSGAGTIDASAFPGTRGTYWTGSPWMGQSAMAIIMFVPGAMGQIAGGAIELDFNKFRARCVR